MCLLKQRLTCGGHPHAHDTHLVVAGDRRRSGYIAQRSSHCGSERMLRHQRNESTRRQVAHLPPTSPFMHI